MEKYEQLYYSFEKKIMNPSVFSICEKILNGNSHGPIVVEIDLTERCNYNCVFCIDELKSRNIILEFNRSDLFSVARDCHDLGVKAIVVTGGGESLLNPYIIDFLIKLKSYNIDIGLVTNGYYLLSVYKEVSSLCNWIRISLNAGRIETYNYLSNPPSDAWDRVIDGIKKCIDIQKAEIAVSFIVLNQNIDEIYIASKLAKNLGCSYIQFKGKYIPGNKKNIAFFPRHLSKKIWLQIEISRVLEDDFFKIFISNTLLVATRKLIVPPKNGYNRCYIQELRTLITPSAIFPCPIHRGNYRFAIPRNDSFKNLWINPSRKIIFQNVNVDLDCPNFCIRYFSNVFLENQIKSNLFDTSEKEVEILTSKPDFFI